MSGNAKIDLFRVVRVAFYGIMGPTPTPRTLPSGGPVDNSEQIRYQSPEQAQEEVDPEIEKLYKTLKSMEPEQE